MNRAAAAVALLAVMMVVSALPYAPAARAADAATGFNVVNVQWGTSAAPVEAAAGGENVLLTVTLQYYYYNTAQSVVATLNLPPGFTDINGNSYANAYVSGNVASGSVLSLSFYLDIGASVELRTYAFPMTITWGAITNTQTLQSVALIQSTSLSIALKGKADLHFKPLRSSLTPGVVNDVSLLLTNNGTGGASQIQTSVVPQGSTLSGPAVSVLSQLPEVWNLSAGSSTLLHLRLYVPYSSTTLPVLLTFTSTYSGAYGYAASAAQVVGMYASSAQTSQGFDAVAAWGSASAPAYAMAGSSNLPLSITVYNLGPGTLYNLTAVFEASAPISPSRGQQSLSKFVPLLATGSSFVMTGYYDVAAGTGKGVYNESLSLSYSNGAASSVQVRGVGVPVLGSATISVSRFAYTPAILYPGMTVATLQVYLVNTGTATASNVSATLQTAGPVHPAYAGSTSTFIGLLPVGSAVPVTFALGIENGSLPQNTTLPLTVASSGGGEARFVIPFNENPKAIMRVDAVSTPAVSVGDGADYVTVTVSNNGSVPAQFATFTLLPSNVFQPSIPSSESPLLAVSAVNATVGTLMPGQQGRFTFVVQVSSSVQPGVYPISLLATWKQPGTTESFAQEVTLPVTVNQILLVTLLPYILAGVAVVAAMAIGLVLRRRRAAGG